MRRLHTDDRRSRTATARLPAVPAPRPYLEAKAFTTRAASRIRNNFADHSSSALPARSPTRWKNGSLPRPATASTSCSPISPAVSTISFIASCPSCNGAGSFAANTRVRRLGRISACLVPRTASFRERCGGQAYEGQIVAGQVLTPRVPGFLAVAGDSSHHSDTTPGRAASSIRQRLNLSRDTL
jgi:hypothetical protein